MSAEVSKKPDPSTEAVSPLPPMLAEWLKQPHVQRLKNLWTLPRRDRPVVGMTPAQVVHTENKWRLLRYAATGPRRYRTPIVLVPSLINRHYVLDLMPGKSLAAYLVDQGFDVYCIDWGTPGDEDRHLTLDTIAGDYLSRAFAVAARLAGVQRVHVLGYCLGGTLSVIHAAARPERVASLLLLAAPVRFADGGVLAEWTRLPDFDVDALVDGFGNVPWQIMQVAFQMLRPTLNLSKGMHFLDKLWDDEYLDGFFALETWGNDNVSFPGEAFRRYIRDLYRDDQLIRGRFTLDGLPARLENITCPTLSVTFEHDNIVPAATAAVLIERIGSADKEVLHLPGGHVGAVVSRGAAKSLWPRLAGWWAARDAAGVSIPE